MCSARSRIISARMAGRPGMPWGFEVVTPREFRFPEKPRLIRLNGARLVSAAPMAARCPASGSAYLLFPSGARGPAFLVTDNFVAIWRYNKSDAYALAIAHLADRLRGGPPLTGKWPADDVQMTRDERIRIQRALAVRGYKVEQFRRTDRFRAARRHPQPNRRKRACAPTAIPMRHCWTGWRSRRVELLQKRSGEARQDLPRDTDPIAQRDQCRTLV